MKKLHISAVQPGAVIAKTVFMENGSVLLGAGMELTQRYIDRLIQLGIDTVYIEDKHTTDIVPEDAISDETRRYAVETVHKTMTGFMNQPQMKGRMTTPDLGTEFHKVFGDILAELSSRKDILVNLTHLHVMEGYLFHHSVNVAIIAGIVGLAKGYNRNQLLELGIGALLFDIGMTQLPKELWNKKSELTKEERMRINGHTEEGFHILRKQHNISLLSAHCALQHHERYNGSGYPRNLADKQIHEYAQIVGLADVYDALISPRAFRRSYSTNEAIEFLFASGNELFDLNLIQLFVKHVAVYPIASTVQLNTGQVGVVSHVDPVAAHRPVIRIIQEADGTPVASPYEIDLKRKENLSLIIVKTL